MTDQQSRIAKTQKYFDALSQVAPALNSASNELTQAVELLDEALKKLNIGIVTWIAFRENNSEDGTDFENEEIGYEKIDGKWGISLRRTWGSHLRDTFNIDGPWLFNDAPRELRLNGVDGLSDLIFALGRAAFDMTKKVQEKTKQVRELTDLIVSPPTPGANQGPTLSQRIQASGTRVPLSVLHEAVSREKKQ